VSGWFGRRRRVRERTTGFPPSGNGASSFHLNWQLPTAEPLAEVAATIEVLVPPALPRLYFWALQVGFTGGGAAHTGLQWLPVGSGRPAVNWGGYRAAGGELDGSVSPLPTLDGNPNTRLYDWEPGRPYRLRVVAAPDGHGWRATVDGATIRDLWSPGDHLLAPIVWSEVFAACDDPSVVVRWSGLEAVTARGAVVVPRGLAVTFQSRADGGCDNTDVDVDAVGVTQTTATVRRTRPGAVIPLRRGQSPGAADA